MAIPANVTSCDAEPGHVETELPMTRMAAIYGASFVPRANDARPLEIQ